MTRNMKAHTISAILVLVCISHLHSEDERTALDRLCSNIPMNREYSWWYLDRCLDGWILLKSKDTGDRDDLWSPITASPYGRVYIGCKTIEPSTFIPWVFFIFKDCRPYIRTIKTKKDRVHLELSFSQAVSDENGIRFKKDIVSYDWPSRSWHVRNGGNVFGEARHIARLYDAEAAEIIRRMYRSHYVTFTDRRTGESNTVLVTRDGREFIEQIMGKCRLSLDEADSLTGSDGTD